MVHLRFAVSIAALALLAASAGARDLNWPGIIGKDDRRMADSTVWPWRAVGRVNYAGHSRYGFCTATLIAPDKAVTAAHCFFEPGSGKLLPLKNFRFALGLARDSYLDVAGIGCLRINPGYRPGTERSADAAASDTAIIVLDKPLKEKPVPLAGDDDLRPGLALSHAGYGRDRPYVLSVHEGCFATSVSNPLALTDCDTNFGQSGGPLLMNDDSGYRIVAIMSGFHEKLATLVVGTKAWRGSIDAGACAGNN